MSLVLRFDNENQHLNGDNTCSVDGCDAGVTYPAACNNPGITCTGLKHKDIDRGPTNIYVQCDTCKMLFTVGYIAP